MLPDANGVLDVAVSFDGAWQRRGHSSHNGVASVIDLITGLPIDYEVLCNFCFKCQANEENEDCAWKEKHRLSCPKNFDGSSNAMEVECALRLWNRSESDILLHFSSSDEHPKHVHCPIGEKSWCFWQRAIATSNDPGSHKEHDTLPSDIGRRLVPIFQRLSEDNLLKRCVRNKTQNPNESLHSTIWKYCPKAIFVG